MDKFLAPVGGAAGAKAAAAPPRNKGGRPSNASRLLRDTEEAKKSGRQSTLVMRPTVAVTDAQTLFTAHTVGVGAVLPLGGKQQRAAETQEASKRARVATADDSGEEEALPGHATPQTFHPLRILVASAKPVSPL